MGEALREHHVELFAVAYWGSIALCVALEMLAPRRELRERVGPRWLGNWSMAAISWVIFRGPLAFSSLAVSLWAERSGFGLFHAVAVPAWLAAGLSFVALDGVRYALHRTLHAVPLLWRLHRSHHNDPDVDVSTNIRAHPLSDVVVMPVLMGFVAVLGVPVAVVIFHWLLQLSVAWLSHSNVRLPDRVDAWLRLLIVTPDFHRTHHSVRVAETNSNYGTLLPWWDYLLGTYVAEPRGGHVGMRCGLEEFRGGWHLGPLGILANPFLASDAPRRGEADVPGPEALPVRDLA